MSGAFDRIIKRKYGANISYLRLEEIKDRYLGVDYLENDSMTHIVHQEDVEHYMFLIRVRLRYYITEQLRTPLKSKITSIKMPHNGTFEVIQALTPDNHPNLDIIIPKGTHLKYFEGPTYGVVNPLHGIALDFGTHFHQVDFDYIRLINVNK